MGASMANDEHIAILKRGVDAWNKWRGQYPDVKPDLTRADLRKEKISEANLSGVKLGDAYLSEAVLDAEVGEPRPHLGVGEARIDLLVELVDNLNGSVLRRPDAKPHAPNRRARMSDALPAPKPTIKRTVRDG